MCTGDCNIQELDVQADEQIDLWVQLLKATVAFRAITAIVSELDEGEELCFQKVAR
jgi:hypothetical protein